MNTKKIFVFVMFMLIVLSDTIQSQTRETLAVLRFNEGTTELQGYLTTELFRTNRFRLVERARLDDVMNEMRLQSSNLSFRDIQRLGQALGVAKIITGEYRIDQSSSPAVVIANVRMIDIRTGFIDISITSRVSTYIGDNIRPARRASTSEYLTILAQDITKQILENY